MRRVDLGVGGTAIVSYRSKLLVALRVAVGRRLVEGAALLTPSVLVL